VYLNFGAGEPAPGWASLDASPYFLLPQFAHRLLARCHLSARSARFAGAPYRFFQFRTGRALPLRHGASRQSTARTSSSTFLPHASQRSSTNLPASLASARWFRWSCRTCAAEWSTPCVESRPGSRSTWNWERFPRPWPTRGFAARWRLEALAGFPSFHRTIIVPEKLEAALRDKWSVRTGLTHLESNIDAAQLRAVETRERCREALIFELRRRIS
jgi:hypothetical protein